MINSRTSGLISRIMQVQLGAPLFARLPRALPHPSIRLLATGGLVCAYYIASDKLNNVRRRHQRAYAITLHSHADSRFRNPCTREVTLEPWTLAAITQITSELRPRHL